MVRNTAELRGLLLDTIQDVRSRKIDHKQAGSISSLSGKVLYSAKLDMDFAKLMAQSGGKKRRPITMEPFKLTQGGKK